MPRGKGPHPRTLEKIHLFVRTELAQPNLTVFQTASVVGVSVPTLARLRKTPQYQQIHAQYLTGVITRLDRNVDDNYNLTRASLQFAVPLAMSTLVQQALHSKDERVRNKASNDILDRDGKFAKVKRVQIDNSEVVNTNEKENKEAAELIAALSSAKQQAAQQQVQSPNITTGPETIQ